jgi:fumarate hydratase class II
LLKNKHSARQLVPGKFLLLPSHLSHEYSLIFATKFSFMEFRTEKDTMGSVQVPADKYWGAQTQRSIDNFKIAQDINKMPKEIIKAFAYLKKAAALTNLDLGVLPADKCELIAKVCDEILAGKLDDQFPLVVWQTGSGTQSNMNLNEVIAYRGHVLQGGKLADEKKFLSPNDDVNKSQSSNDTFPTAMHIAAYKILMETTLPGIEKLRETLAAKVEAIHEGGEDWQNASHGCYASYCRPGIIRLCFTTRSRNACDQKHTSTSH